MLRHSVTDQIPTFLFGSALLSMVLGFGVFFDHLAESVGKPSTLPAEPALGYDLAVVPRVAGVLLASYEPDDLKAALTTLKVPPEFVHDHLHPPRVQAPALAGARERKPL